MQMTQTQSPHASADRWLTLIDGVRYAQISVGTLRRAIREGKLRHARAGKVIRLRREWIDLWLGG